MNDLERYKQSVVQRHQTQLQRVKHQLKEEMARITLVRNRAGLMLTSFMHSMIDVEAVDQRLIHGDIDMPNDAD